MSFSRGKAEGREKPRWELQLERALERRPSSKGSKILAPIPVLTDSQKREIDETWDVLLTASNSSALNYSTILYFLTFLVKK